MIKKVDELENVEVGKSCKGKKCPHFGTTMIEKDGVLICPLHNLKGSLKTSKIVKSY